MLRNAAFSGPALPLTVDAIREHYDRLSPLYRMFWGEHIHHGYWMGNESPAQAQENLTQELAQAAQISPDDHVLDIGCGLGGSSMYLAQHFGCRVDGMTLSPVQAKVAGRKAKERGLSGQTRFEVQDANRLGELPARAYDVIWIVECSEHLFDKAAFIETCARWLRPGGRLAICAWLASENPGRAQRRLLEEVRRGMLCPSFGTMREYIDWMGRAGLHVAAARDITSHVLPTWDLCRKILAFPLVKKIVAKRDRRLREFAASFTSIDQAYRSGAMAYGLFAAEKPVNR